MTIPTWLLIVILFYVAMLNFYLFIMVRAFKKTEVKLDPGMVVFIALTCLFWPITAIVFYYQERKEKQQNEGGDI